MAVTVEQLADEMYELIAKFQGKKKFKAMDLQKQMTKQHPDEVDRKMCKDAIRQLTDTGRCVYTYFGGSYIEVPHKEAAAND